MAKCTYHHLQGPMGLSEAVDRVVESVSTHATENLKHILVFDFDRTLTNGFASPDANLPVEKRIRGGSMTLESLRKAKSVGSEMFIITARSPTRLTIEQLEASMKNCQQELAEIFIKQDQTKELDQPYRVEKVNGRNLAWRGRLFASDYSKPIAMQQILSEISLAETTNHHDISLAVHFFDDYVMNAFDIGAGDYGPKVVDISTYWWDTHLEETSGSIGLVYSFSSDFPYQKGCESALLAFGIDHEKLEERRRIYLEFEAKHNIKPKAKEVLAAPKQVEANVKANLGSLLAGRGLGPPKLLLAEPSSLLPSSNSATTTTSGTNQ